MMEQLITVVLKDMINDIDHARDYIILAVAIFQIVIVVYLLLGGWYKLSKSCSKEEVEAIVDNKFAIRLNTLEIKLSDIISSQYEIKENINKILFKNFT